jgi:hypothetical protein
VISGWEMGFEWMKVGGKRRLFIPYQMDYGELGGGSIPPKAELVFDVRLLQAETAPEPPAAGADYTVLVEPGGEQSDASLPRLFPRRDAAGVPDRGYAPFSRCFCTSHTSDADEVKKMIEDNEKGEQQPISKEKTLAALTGSFAEAHKHLDEVRAQALTRDAEFFGQKTTRRGILICLDTHMGEHRVAAIR